jgi:hypothetical protein
MEGILGHLIQKIITNINQIHALIGLRDILLPKLISGDVKLGD